MHQNTQVFRVIKLLVYLGPVKVDKSAMQVGNVEAPVADDESEATADDAAGEADRDNAEDAPDEAGDIFAEPGKELDEEVALVAVVVELAADVTFRAVAESEMRDAAEEDEREMVN